MQLFMKVLTFFLLFLLLNTTVVFSQRAQRDENLTEQLNPDQALKNVLPFPLGAAVKVNALKNNEAYRELIKSQFNSITAENAMKFGPLHPAPDVFKFANADFIVDFALKNNIRVHGHALIWPRNLANPKWVLDFKGDKRAWDSLLRVHVTTIVKHFKGKVASWDVVNEAFADNGMLNKNIWLENMGPDYIAKAFQYAHEADPKALLFYNDYGQEYDGRKIRAILKMVADFKKRGIPIDGLGLQFHTNARVSKIRITTGIFTAAKSGLLIHLSELEVGVRFQKDKSFKLTPEMAAQQAEKYKNIFQIYGSIPKKQQFGITTWNVSDGDSFRNSKYKDHDHPLLFDSKYQPKDAYKVLLEAYSK